MWVVIAGLAALGSVVVGLAALEAARRWNRSAAKRDEKVADALGEIAEDIDHLRTLTEGAIEAAQRREQTNVPRPRVVALVKDQETESLIAALRPLRRVDVDALLQVAMTCAEERGPVLPAPGPFGIAMHSFGTPTQYDVERYDKELDEYELRLRAQLEQLRLYEEDQATLIVVRLRIHNDGFVPLEDPRLVVRLPDGLHVRTHVAKPPKLDAIPRWRSTFLTLNRVQLTRVEPLFNPHLLSSEFRPLVMPPRAEWIAQDIQHGEQRDTTPLILQCTSPGDYVLEWEAHADNLAEPARGEISVTVSKSPDAAIEVRSLADVGLERDEDDDD